EGNRQSAEAVIGAERGLVTGSGDQELAGALVVVDAGYRTVQMDHSTERGDLLTERVLDPIHAPNRLEEGRLPQEIGGLIEAGLLPILRSEQPIEINGLGDLAGPDSGQFGEASAIGDILRVVLPGFAGADDITPVRGQIAEGHHQ